MCQPALDRCQGQGNHMANQTHRLINKVKFPKTKDAVTC